VTVTDNGRGFPGDVGQLGKLFVRHARSSGSGVGLYIVRQLIKRMNGTIRFRSSESEGFVAEFELPEAPGTKASGVLIVTDRSDNQHAGSVPTNYEATVASRR